MVTIADAARIRRDFEDKHAVESLKFEVVFIIAMGVLLVVYLARFIAVMEGVGGQDSNSKLPLVFGSIVMLARAFNIWTRRCVKSGAALSAMASVVAIMDMCMHLMISPLMRCVIPDTFWDAIGETGTYVCGDYTVDGLIFVYMNLSFWVIFVLLHRHAMYVTILWVVSFGLLLHLAPDHDDKGLGAFRSLNIIWRISFFVVIGVFLLFHKKMFEQSKFKLFEHLQQKTGEVIEEKILRCQAEFGMEQVKAIIQPRADTGQLTSYLTDGGLTPRVEAAPISKRPPGSAPAALCHVGSDEECIDAAADESLGDCGGDCLPADAVVWVMDETLPVQLSKLELGRKILCYDQISRSMRYTEVTNVAHDDSAADWVKLILEDGTSLDLTADHPVHQMQREGTPAEYVEPYAKRAEDLEADVDTVMVLKMLPVYVKRVEKYADTAERPSRARVSVAVKQPNRHSIFVAGNGQHPTVAVGSVDAQLFQYTCSEKKTFLHYETGHGVTAPRPRSAPSSIRHVPEDALPAGTQGRTTASSSSGHSSSPGTGSSHSSSHPSQGATDLILGVDNAPANIQVPGTARIANLSFVSQLRNAGLKSIGGQLHDHGKCVPCRFDWKKKLCEIPSELCPQGAREYISEARASTIGCRLGAYCPRCHEPHDHCSRRPKRKARPAPRTTAGDAHEASAGAGGLGAAPAVPSDVNPPDLWPDTGNVPQRLPGGEPAGLPLLRIDGPGGLFDPSRDEWTDQSTAAAMPTLTETTVDNGRASAQQSQPSALPSNSSEQTSLSLAPFASRSKHLSL